MCIRDRDTPCSCDYVGISEAEYIGFHRQIGYWKSLHLRDVQKMAQMDEELRLKDARIKDLENQLFGKKSEKGSTAKSEADASPKSTRKRGQQEKAKGHGRTDVNIRLTHPPSMPKLVVLENFELMGTPIYGCGLQIM